MKMAGSRNEIYLQEGNKRYSYFAFISYKHRDRRWAKWLQHQLEGYRLPNHICREKDAPRRLSPVFRDETDLTAGKTVYSHIGEKLGACKYLIVICTRNMQHSPEYIDFEIEQFLAAGNSPARILPLIIDDGDESTRMECFPPALMHLGSDRPLGITLNPSKKHDAVLKLVAAMLDIELQALRSHDQARRLKRIAAGFALGLTASLAFSASVVWEMLNVKEARLREQNSYTAASYEDGDRSRAHAMALYVQQEMNPLMDAAIADEAAKLQTLASIKPKYSTLLHLARKTGDSRSMFDRDGRHVMLITGNSVKKYSLQGELVLQFDSAGLGQKIIDVSSDGLHAVVMTINDGEAGAALWLYDMEKRLPLAKLAASNAHDMSDLARGNLFDVLDARFSPDGRLCAAFCTGGYFNTNDELPVYSAETGEKLASVPGELLGDRSDGGQGAVVESFEFISDTLLRWGNSHYNVYYSTESDSACRASVQDMAFFTEYGLDTGAGRYAVGTTQTNPDSFTVFDQAGENILEYPSGDGTPCFGSIIYGEKHALLAWGEEGIDRIDLLDLESGRITASTLDCAEFAAGHTEISIHEFRNSAGLYVQLSKGRRSQWLRFDPEEGSCRIADASFRDGISSGCIFVALGDGRDLLIFRDGAGTGLYEISADRVQRFAIDENFESFSQNLLISPENSSVLLSQHNDMYSLFSAENAGEQLGTDAEADAEAIHACSADGSLLLRAQGRNAALWHENTRILEVVMDYNIHSAGISADGSSLMLCCANELTVRSVSGEVLARTEADGGRRFASAKLSRDSKRILLLDEPQQRYSDEWYGLTLLNAGTLKPIARLSGDVLRSSYAAAAEVYDLSPDGRCAAAVERLYLGEQYQRVLTVWSLEDGEQLARSFNFADPDGAILEFGADIGMADVFSYACFGENGLLLAGASSGVWVFDMDSMQTLAYLPDAAPRTGLPQMLGESILIYPCDDVHIWDLEQRALLTSIGADMEAEGFLSGDIPYAGRIALSEDGRLMLLSDRSCARIFDTENWEELGRMGNCPAELIRLEPDFMIYASEEGLFRQNLKP